MVRNKLGTVTSSGAVLTVLAASAPVFAQHPASSSVTLSASATGDPAPTYQWTKDQQVIPGATSNTLLLQNVGPSDAGVYAVIAANTLGTAVSNPATLTVASASARTAMTNISTRSRVGTGDDVMIVGFIAGGASPKTLLIRASGPALGKFNLPGLLTDPVLDLHDASKILQTNDNWGEDSAQALTLLQGFQQAGAFSWELGSKDSAMRVTLDPGAYTAIVRGKADTTGVSLVEVYELDGATGSSRLVNLSTRSNVGTSDNVQIAGFIVSGSVPKRVVVRGSGPALKKYGVSGVLEDPTLSLHDVDGVIAENDNWDASLRPEFQRLGIDNWETGSKDCALEVTLNPGAYTAIIRGKNDTTGVALVEVIEAD